MARHRLYIWAEAGQESVLADAARHEAMEIAGIGSDDASVASRLAQQCSVPMLKDLRSGIHDDSVDAIWIAGALDLEVDVPGIASVINQRQVKVFVSQPQPSSFSSVISEPSSTAAGLGGGICFVPLMRRSPGYRSAVEPLSDFGWVACVNISFRSGLGQGSLYARLFDAMDVVETLCGGSDLLDAAFVNPDGGVPEELGDLTGHMTLNLRFSDGRCACISASDQAGAWFRGITVLGEGGCIRISDDGCEWIDPAGVVLDAYQEDVPSTPGEMAMLAIQRELDGLDTVDQPGDVSRLLALCEAARLSCRTGEGEAPQKVLKMLRRP